MFVEMVLVILHHRTFTPSATLLGGYPNQFDGGPRWQWHALLAAFLLNDLPHTACKIGSWCMQQHCTLRMQHCSGDGLHHFHDPPPLMTGNHALFLLHSC